MATAVAQSSHAFNSDSENINIIVNTKTIIVTKKHFFKCVGVLLAIQNIEMTDGKIRQKMINIIVLMTYQYQVTTTAGPHRTYPNARKYQLLYP